MAKRRRVRGSAALERQLAHDNVSRAIATELGLAPTEQLELAIATPARPRAGFAPLPACSECDRRGYHLATCSRRTS